MWQWNKLLRSYSIQPIPLTYRSHDLDNITITRVHGGDSTPFEHEFHITFLGYGFPSKDDRDYFYSGKEERKEYISRQPSHIAEMLRDDIWRSQFYVKVNFNQLLQLFKCLPTNYKRMCNMVLPFQPCKSFYDLDASVNDNIPEKRQLAQRILADVNGKEKLLDELFESFTSFYEKTFNSFPNLSGIHVEDASTSTKLSLHIYNFTEAFKDVFHQKFFMEEWKEEIENHLSPNSLLCYPYITEKEEKSFAHVIDFGIYTPNRPMRMFGCSKVFGQSLVYLPYRVKNPNLIPQPQYQLSNPEPRELLYRDIINYCFAVPPDKIRAFGANEKISAWKTNYPIEKEKRKLKNSAFREYCVKQGCVWKKKEVSSSLITHVSFRGGVYCIDRDDERMKAYDLIQQDYKRDKIHSLGEMIDAIDADTTLVNLFADFDTPAEVTLIPEYKETIVRSFASSLKEFGVIDNLLLYLSEKHDNFNQTKQFSNFHLNTQICSTVTVLRRFLAHLLQNLTQCLGHNAGLDVQVANKDTVNLRMNYSYKGYGDNTLYKVCSVWNVNGMCDFEMKRVNSSIAYELRVTSIRPFSTTQPYQLQIPSNCPSLPPSPPKVSKSSKCTEIALIQGSEQFQRIKLEVETVSEGLWKNERIKSIVKKRWVDNPDIYYYFLVHFHGATPCLNKTFPNNREKVGAKHHTSSGSLKFLTSGIKQECSKYSTKTEDRAAGPCKHFCSQNLPYSQTDTAELLFPHRFEYDTDDDKPHENDEGNDVVDLDDADADDNTDDNKNQDKGDEDDEGEGVPLQVTQPKKKRKREEKEEEQKAETRKKKEKGFNPAQKLIKYIGRVCARKGYVRSDSNVYKEILLPNPADPSKPFRTHAYEKHKSIFDFIMEETTEEHNPTEWKWRTSNGAVINTVARDLENNCDTFCPRLERNRRQWSFKNGIYLADTDTFISYTEMGNRVLDTKSLQYIPHDLTDKDPIGDHYTLEDGIYKELNGNVLYNEKTKEGHKPIRSWMEISTPTTDKVLEAQTWPSQAKMWYYIFAGRYAFPIGPANGGDDWQKAVYLKGIGGVGKTILKANIMNMLNPGDILTLESDGETVFALQSAADEKNPKLMVVIPEVTDSMRLSFARFLEMVGAERMTIPVKNSQAVEIVWAAALLMLGNGDIPFNDPGGALSRRLVIFNFLRAIRDNEKDTTLSARMQSELPNFIRKAVQGYLFARKHVGASAIDDKLPEYFQQSRKKMRLSTDIVCRFIDENCIRAPDRPTRAKTQTTNLSNNRTQISLESKNENEQGNQHFIVPFNGFKECLMKYVTSSNNKRKKIITDDQLRDEVILASIDREGCAIFKFGKGYKFTSAHEFCTLEKDLDTKSVAYKVTKNRISSISYMGEEEMGEEQYFIEGLKLKPSIDADKECIVKEICE